MSAKRGKDAEEAMKRRKLLRKRFRGLIRSVMFNRIWLVEPEDQKLSLNVKKNVAMMVRPQRQIGILTLADKSLLRTHRSLRTVEERRKLVNLLTGLECFSKIPPKVRARLAPAVTFLYLGAGRTLIREGDPPATVYYILSGEVEISKSVYDPLTKKHVDQVDSIAGPGACVGDVEMLELCLRKNTYVTTSSVELIVILELDFERIMRPVMSKLWFEKKAAVQAFEYFNYFSEDQAITACKLGMLRQFEPLETIYYEDKGIVDYVHFILSGDCMILQCLELKVTQGKYDKHFELADLSKDAIDNMFQQLQKEDLLEQLKEEESAKMKVGFELDYDAQQHTEVQSESYIRKAVMLKMDPKSIFISCGLKTPSKETLVTSSERGFDYLDEFNDGEEFDYDEHDSEQDKLIEDNDYNDTEASEAMSFSKERKSISRASMLTRASKTTVQDAIKLKPSNIEKQKAQPGVRFKSKPKTPKAKIENHFIDVGSISFGGIFGLGESLEQRVVMARTTVQCLMIPRFWLFEREQNPGNIWQRRRFYLDATIPSRQALFKDFLTTRKWRKFKNDLIERSLDHRSVYNPTKIEDIPIICRIIETHDD